MVRLNLLIFLTEIELLFYSSRASFVEDVTSAEWDGVELYISVKREAIQKKLDVFHSSVTKEYGGKEGTRLFIPSVPVLPGLHQVNHHPVYLEVGYLTSNDFDACVGDNSNHCVSPSGIEVGVSVPLLSGSPTDRPKYALALAKFYQKSRGDIPHRNLMYPYIPVEEIQMTDHEALVRNGSEELRISFNKSDHPCKPPTSIVKQEFDEYFLDNLQFGLPKPDYTFCDRHSCDSRFCSNIARVRCDVNHFAPNVCQVYKANDMTPCAASVKIENVTSRFRDFILLGNDPVDIPASRWFSNNASVGLKYPCQDK